MGNLYWSEWKVIYLPSQPTMWMEATVGWVWIMLLFFQAAVPKWGQTDGIYPVCVHLFTHSNIRSLSTSPKNSSWSCISTTSPATWCSWLGYLVVMMLWWLLKMTGIFQWWKWDWKNICIGNETYCDWQESLLQVFSSDERHYNRTRFTTVPYNIWSLGCTQHVSHAFHLTRYLFGFFCTSGLQVGC